MSPTDLVTAAVILSAAGGLLYRSMKKARGGACHGCGGCPSGRRDPGKLVTLGRGGAADRAK